MRTILFVVLCAIVSICTAQDIHIEDKEFSSLINAVKLLHNPNAENCNRAKQILMDDVKWTLMDELKDQNNAECILTRKMKRFNLTSIINGVLSERYGKADVPGHFLNGEDSRYNYSLIEKGIKAKKKAKYTFKGRVGKQDFVIIPCDPQSTKLSIKFSKGTTTLKTVQKKDSDGIIYLHIDSKLKGSESITMEIENKSEGNVAIAILNHNTRK